MAAKSSPESRNTGWLQCILALAVVLIPLLVLFGRALNPDYIVFSNDGPLGGMVADHNRMPEILTGIWQDLNWLGGPYPPPFPDPSTMLRLITSPLFYAKLFAPFSLFCVGIGAWFCFRQYKFSPIACLLVAAAAVLNSDFVGTAAWGVCSQPIAFGLNFLALGALADATSPRRWIRAALAGFAVGLGVAEAYDIGALFSMFVGVFVVAQALAGDGSIAKRVVEGIGRLAIVSICAGLIACAALMTLVGTQVKGIAGMGQDAESKAARWHQAVTYSIPKLETLGMIVPGFFGLRGDSPEGKTYWGRGGSDPSWDEFVDSGGKAGNPDPRYPFRAGAGSNYSGVLVVLVAIFGVAQSFRRQGGPFTWTEKKLVWFWALMALMAMLLMFGRFAPYYQFFYALPYASTIRNPAKFHHVVQWALLIVFAHGAEALGRAGLSSAATVASGMRAQWKSFWSKATGFDRKWIVASFLVVGIFIVGWLILASSRTRLESHVLELTRLQYLAMAKAQGMSSDAITPYVSQAAGAAQATAKFSIGQVARTVWILIPAVGLMTITLSGYFRGPRAKIGGVLLLAVLVIDLLPFARSWVVMVNWTQKYKSNSIIQFLAERPYEHRVTRVPIDSSRLQREAGQLNQALMQLYIYDWTQHLFLYNNIQCADVVQEPRVATDKAAYEAVLNAVPMRRWELSNTRYFLGLSGLLDGLNQQMDARRNRFRIATQFDLTPEPDSSGLTTVIQTNAAFSVFDFTGALPRAKLYVSWKVSTNDPALLENWSKGIQAVQTRDVAQALASQTPAELATLHELADPAFDPAKTVLLSEPLPKPPGTNQDAGDVKFDSYAPKKIVLAAKANAPCVLLLNDKYDSNWRVTVDGEPAPLLRCNYMVRGVFLDKPGEHRVVFKFQPPLTGLYVSTATTIVGVGLLCFVVLGTRKQALSSGEKDRGKK
jgi:hypothetical protein